MATGLRPLCDDDVHLSRLGLLRLTAATDLGRDEDASRVQRST